MYLIKGYLFKDLFKGYYFIILNIYFSFEKYNYFGINFSVSGYFPLHTVYDCTPPTSILG